MVGDIVEIARNILSNAKDRVPASSFKKAKIQPIPLKDMSKVESEYFLRFNVLDKPGVLSIISGILGDHSISIKSMIQKGRGEKGKAVSLVMMCHRSCEGNIQKALKKIEQLDVVCGKSNLIRVEK